MLIAPVVPDCPHETSRREVGEVGKVGKVAGVGEVAKVG
jgi:hypothetical protein